MSTDKLACGAPITGSVHTRTLCCIGGPIIVSTTFTLVVSVIVAVVAAMTERFSFLSLARFQVRITRTR